MRNDFATFILSHGRAEEMRTVHALQRQGYSGEWYILLDSDDDQQPQYVKNFGQEHVIVFDRKDYYNRNLLMDNKVDYKALVIAREAVNHIAKNMGFRYILVLDDDYSRFDYRWPKDHILKAKFMPDIDKTIESSLNAFIAAKLDCLCWGQAGDLLGGVGNEIIHCPIKRKAMNSFFIDLDKPIQFYGRRNEDCTMYVLANQTGAKMLTYLPMTVIQSVTQSLKGGVTELYLQEGTYIKTMYSVMAAPAIVKVATVGTANPRIHHRINWEVAAPKILDEKWKK